MKAMTNNAPISMSGVVSLDAQQTELLTTLGLDVPPMMTREQFVRLLAQADQVSASFSEGLAAHITREELARLRACFGVA
jgi:hypothetical protein